MSTVLCIETAAEVCSVALVSEGGQVDYKAINKPNAHSRFLTVLIEQLFEETGMRAEKLSAVALSKGPGSYTGLRIGASVAKGICYAAGIPLIAMDTLEIIARGISPDDLQENDLIIPMLDARRMEVYASVYNSRFDVIREAEPVVLQENSFETFLNQGKVHFCGNGNAKFSGICKHPNARFHADDNPLTARAMAIPALRMLDEKSFEDHVYFEPEYLKPVMATKPSKKWF